MPEAPGFGPVAPGPLDARRRGSPGGRLPHALRGRTRLYIPKLRSGFLSVRDHQPSGCGRPRPEAHLSVQGSWLSVSQSRIPSTHGVFRLPPEAAPERDRKFGHPTRAYPLAFFSAPRVLLRSRCRPSGSRWERPPTPLPTGVRNEDPQRPAPASLPFRALGSAKSETGQFILAVT